MNNSEESSENYEYYESNETEANLLWSIRKNGQEFKAVLDQYSVCSLLSKNVLTNMFL